VKPRQRVFVAPAAHQNGTGKRHEHNSKIKTKVKVKIKDQSQSQAHAASTDSVVATGVIGVTIWSWVEDQRRR
jgi:hypothetical protein